jgi:hypothetical protein
MGLKINENTFNAIMISALKTMDHEAWLIEADELSESTGAPVAEIIEGLFQPFADRLVAASNFDQPTPENIAKAKRMFFAKFTDLACP